jgi:hypothetical protein
MLTGALLLGIIFTSWGRPASAADSRAEWEAHVRDSLFSVAAGVMYPVEPSIQDILDNFGYDIDAENDMLDLDVFCLFPQSTWTLMAEYSGAAATHTAGWYSSLAPHDTHTVLTGSHIPGDAAIMGGGLSGLHGIFHRRDAGTTWYSQTALNYDGTTHHRVYALPGGVGYIVFWEDLGWVTDGDYNDMVFEVRPQNQAPQIGIALAKLCGAACPPHLICEGDSVCLEILVSDPGCFGDTVTVSMVTGEGTFSPVIGVGDFTPIHCWVPVWEGSKQFIFRATDNLGLWSEVETWVIIAFDHTPPVLPEAYIGQRTACLPEQICIDFPIGDESIHQLWIEPIGAYNENLQQVCFDADTAGTYTLWVRAVDTCENEASTMVQVTVETTSPPVITADPDNYFDICGPDSLCVGFSAYDPDDDIDSIWTTAPGMLNFTDSTLCYKALEPDLVQIPIYIVDLCGYADTAFVNFHITGGGGATLTCPGMIDTVLCEDGAVCFPISVSNSAASITVSPIGVYDPQNRTVCFTTNGTGVYNLRLIAEDDCGGDTCDVTVNVTINEYPSIAMADDYARFLCRPEQLCVPFICTDPDDNLASCTIIEAPAGYTVIGSEVCFMPTADGVYRVIAEAADECGLTDRDTVLVTVTLNEAPVISGAGQLAVGLCAADSVCIDVDITDADGNLAEVIASPNAAYNKALGRVCFYAAADGIYTIRLIAVDECDDADTLDIAVDVTLNAAPNITCPDPLDTLLCEAGVLCVDMNLPSIAGGLTVTVSPIGYYNPATDRLCFDADTAGVYLLTVTAVDTCGGQDMCTAQVTVGFNNPPQVIGQTTLDFNLCKPQQICFPVSCFDPDGNLSLCEKISGPGTYNGTQICFTPAATGVYNFTVRATDLCGLTAQLNISVHVVIDRPPVIVAPADTSALVCDPGMICVEYTVADPDGGDVSVTSTLGTVIEAENLFCMYFDADGTACADLIAEDICGNKDTAHVCFTADVNRKPEIIVAGDFDTALCGPTQVCLPVQVIEPEGIASASVLPFGAFNAAHTEFCFDADTSGSYKMTLIVVDICGDADTATVTVSVDLNDSPVLTVPGDQAVFFCLPGQSVCITGIVAADPDDNLTGVALTSGIGILNMFAGELCFDPDTAGHYCFEITATDDCGSTAVKTFCVTMYAGAPPVITLVPTVDVDIEEPGEICFPVRSDDADLNQLFDLSLLSGAGTFPSVAGRNTINAEHCFWADTAGCYPFVFESVDSCGLFDIESTVVCITITPPDSSFRICIDTISALNGYNVDLAVIVYEAMPFGGFDLLICFDPSVLSFNHVTKGPAIQDWEYFTYRAASPAGCVSPCNVTAVHLIGVADMNNGSSHPPEEALLPKGDLAYLNFFVTEDRNVIGQCIPIQFCWYDCTDNALSSPTGDTTYLAYNIADLLPGENCLSSEKPFLPLPLIDFCNGRICVIPPPDDRGDINLNGIANEIGDAVLFTNYFLYGNSVWHPIYYENQWLASDINNDGMTRSIADLVYLIRILTGDAEPIPASGEGKVLPYGDSVQLETRYEDGELIITSRSPVSMGGLFLRLSGDFSQAERPRFAGEVASMPPKYRLTDSGLRILLTSMEKGVTIPEGYLELARIPMPEAGDISISEADASTYQGQSISVDIHSARAVVPQGFELAQNYPNPFNAGTVIQFALPYASDYRITIYDVTGRKVREFSGAAEAGIMQVYWDGCDEGGRIMASGIYFYRASSGEFSDSRKMILMK